MTIKKFEAATGFRPSAKCWESVLRPAYKESEMSELEWEMDIQKNKFDYLLMCYDFEMELKKRALRQARHIKHCNERSTINVLVDMLN